MSLENRANRMKREISVYSVISDALQKDREAMFTHFKQRGNPQTLNEEIVDVYELRPAELPDLALPNSFSFIDGFSYVASQWYHRFVRVIGTGLVTPDKEPFMDGQLEEMFRDGTVTTQQIRDSLKVDPSGATWLEERAKFEFRERNLALIGARKAITGIRKMHEALTAAA